jgi:thioredoxin-like negative regulator of GroEL
MADPIEELFRAWKASPSTTTTAALCDALREDPRDALVHEVAAFARQRHKADVAVLISVARMYIEANRFMDAQATLVAAGQKAPREAKVYRWLGEVLLRRGDAERAEKVLERLVQLGSADPDVKVWVERARSYRAMQKTAGARAVAAEVAHAHATKGRAALPPQRASAESASDETDTDVFAPVHTSEIQGSTPVPATAAPQRSAPPRPTSSRPPRPGSTPPPLPAFPLPPLAAPAPPLRPAAPAAKVAPIATAVPAASAAPVATAAVPHPRDVLDALALAGVFEPTLERTAAGAAWDHAARAPKRRGAPLLITGMAVFLAANVGVYFSYRAKRAREHIQAEDLLATVEARLHAAKPGELADAESELTRVFQLESRSQRAALDWARERAMRGLVKNGAEVAFEDAMARAKEVGVPEEKYAFARVASFLFQGDTAGAAAVLPRWEASAGEDAWYQMVAGATLERAGDARARERYARAHKLDPGLFAAQEALARSTAMDGDVQEAMRLSKAMRAAMPERAEPVALVALSWGRDAQREDIRAPSEAAEVGKRQD